MAKKNIIKIRFSVDKVLNNFQLLKLKFTGAIEKGVEKAANQLLCDCRAYVPMLTGRLRDSGKVKYLKNYAYMLIWDAMNPKNSYIYAQRQYNEVFQHVDGKYAATWVKRTLENNPGRYTFLASFYTQIELKRNFKGA